MPQIPIPEYNPKTSLVADAPPGLDINPQAFGAQYEAMARVGEKLANIGTDLLEKRVRVQAEDWASTRGDQDLRDFHANDLETQKSLPASYDGYTDKTKEWITERLKKAEEEAPSDLARRVYKARMHSQFNEALIRANGLEYVKKAESAIRNTEESANQNASFLQQNPNVGLSEQMIANTQSDIQQKIRAGLYSEEAGIKLNKKLSNQLANAVLQGLFNNGSDEAYSEAWRILNAHPANAVAYKKSEAEIKAVGIDALVKSGMMSQDDANKLKARDAEAIKRAEKGSKFIDPTLAKNTPIPPSITVQSLNDNEVGDWLGRFARIKKSKEAAKIDDFRVEYQENIYGLQNGVVKDINPSVLNKLNIMVREGKMTDATAARHRYGLVDARITYENVEAKKHAPESDWPGIDAATEAQREAARKASGLKASAREDFGIQYAGAHSEKIAEASNAIQKLRNTDPFRSIQDDPEVNRALSEAPSSPEAKRKAIRLALDKQKYVGVQFPRVTSNQSAKADAMALMSIGDEQAGSQAIDKAHMEYGENFPKYMQELITHGNLPEHFRVIAFTNNPYDRQRLYAAAKNGKELKERIKNDPDINIEKFNNSVVRALEPYLAPIARSSAGGNKQEYLNAITDLVKADAYAKLATGANDGAAIKQAVTIVSNMFQQVNEGQSKIVVPTTIGGVPMDVDRIKSFMKAKRTPQAWDEMGVVAPSQPEFDAATNKRKFYDYLKGNSSWQLNRDQDGMMLMYKHTERGWQHVLNEDKKPIEFKFYDITKGRVK